VAAHAVFPRWGLTALPKSLAEFKGPLRGREKRGKGKKGGKRKGKGGKG